MLCIEKKIQAMNLMTSLQSGIHLHTFLHNMDKIIIKYTVLMLAFDKVVLTVTLEEGKSRKELRTQEIIKHVVFNFFK